MPNKTTGSWTNMACEDCGKTSGTFAMTTEDLQEFLLDSGDWVNDPDQGLLCAECAEDGGWEFDENTSTWEHEDVA